MDVSFTFIIDFGFHFFFFLLFRYGLVLAEIYNFPKLEKTKEDGETILPSPFHSVYKRPLVQELYVSRLRKHEKPYVEKPHAMPDQIQNIMDKCFRYTIALRPSFTEIVKMMTEACENVGSNDKFIQQIVQD